MAQPKVADLSSQEGREQIYLEIIDHLNRYNAAERAWIAETAGVSKTTINNWCALRTWSPQIRTLAHVARTLGYDIVLKRQRPAPPKLKVVVEKQKAKKK
jgi:DNA-binding phage protein